MTPKQFRHTVWNHYETHGRHGLPWRTTDNPYRILVSEVMLQQTQVERVIPYYRAWLKRFPSARSLATAPLSDVLTLWQGLGYNRRAKALWETARVIQRERGGRFPISEQELERLPGVGPYTASAMCAFAYNHDVILVETNIRTAVVHHYFKGEEVVDDASIKRVLEKVLPKGESRAWYYALMDYGSHLKRRGIRLNARTKGYVKQARFSGSNREARGAILRALSQGPLSVARLTLVCGELRKQQVAVQIAQLHTDGLIEKVGRRYQLPA